MKCVRQIYVFKYLISYIRSSLITMIKGDLIMKKKMILGMVSLACIFAVVAATISYNASYEGSISGTTNSPLLSFAEADTDSSSGPIIGTFTPDLKNGGFTLTSLQLPAGASTTFAVCTVTSTQNVRVEISVAGSNAEDVTVVTTSPLDLTSGVPTDIDITVDLSMYSKGYSFSFTLTFTVTTPV